MVSLGQAGEPKSSITAKTATKGTKGGAHRPGHSARHRSEGVPHKPEQTIKTDRGPQKEQQRARHKEATAPRPRPQGGGALPSVRSPEPTDTNPALPQPQVSKPPHHSTLAQPPPPPPPQSAPERTTTWRARPSPPEPAPPHALPKGRRWAGGPGLHTPVAYRDDPDKLRTAEGPETIGQPSGAQGPGVRNLATWPPAWARRHTLHTPEPGVSAPANPPPCLGTPCTYKKPGGPGVQTPVAWPASMGTPNMRSSPMTRCERPCKPATLPRCAVHSHEAQARCAHHRSLARQPEHQARTPHHKARRECPCRPATLHGYALRPHRARGPRCAHPHSLARQPGHTEHALYTTEPGVSAPANPPPCPGTHAPARRQRAQKCASPQPDPPA